MPTLSGGTGTSNIIQGVGQEWLDKARKSNRCYVVGAAIPQSTSMEPSTSNIVNGVKPRWRVSAATDSRCNHATDSQGNAPCFDIPARSDRSRYCLPSASPIIVPEDASGSRCSLVTWVRRSPLESDPPRMPEGAVGGETEGHTHCAPRFQGDQVE
ncbi:hypothetical protein V5799_023402 [Amblyomma americanum]|uniref:Uncharacterized protein n=1 Tax=Amblyomma americanum TaxID=6943 RepID=A0AAQ4FJN6_AMBAM